MNALRFLILLFLFFKTLSSSAQQPVEKWQADLAFLKTELPKYHPDFFRHYPKKNFETDLANLSANLDGKNDLQIALELQSIVARAQDAQTRLDLAPLLQLHSVIPIGLGWYAEGLCVSATVKKFGVALGKKVLEINGLKTEVALERIGRFFAQENPEALRKEGPQWLRFPEALRLAGVSGNDTLALLLADENGQKYFVKTFPLDFQKDKSSMFPAQFMPKNPDLRWNPEKQLFSLHWLAKDSIAYLQYNGCFSREMSLAAGDSLGAQQLPPFQPLVDSLQRLLTAHSGARFFFDLRFNTSGNPADGIALAKRLGAQPLLNRPDRLYVAVNRYTTTAAVEIAAAFKAHTRATLLGEPPANRPNHVGDARPFLLPNSHVQVYYGSRRSAALKGDPAVLPMDEVIELPFAAFRDGRDPLLDFVRKR